MTGEEEEKDETYRNMDLGAKLIEKNSREYLIVYSDKTGGFGYATSNRTWAMGALKRAAISLEERERIDTRRAEDD